MKFLRHCGCGSNNQSAQMNTFLMARYRAIKKVCIQRQNDAVMVALTGYERFSSLAHNRSLAHNLVS
jgi:hypothetical protein